MNLGLSLGAREYQRVAQLGERFPELSPVNIVAIDDALSAEAVAKVCRLAGGLDDGRLEMQGSQVWFFGNAPVDEKLPNYLQKNDKALRARVDDAGLS